jgi:hypothetical protein
MYSGEKAVSILDIPNRIIEGSLCLQLIYGRFLSYPFQFILYSMFLCYPASGINVTEGSRGGNYSALLLVQNSMEMYGVAVSRTPRVPKFERSCT